MAFSGCTSHVISPSMERTSQWVSSQEVASDLVVRIGDSVFPLHKAVMVPKCGYIRKAATACGDRSATIEVDLSALPGGADAFEKVARYCYGVNFEISVHNVAALRCAAAHLDMPRDGGLARRAEEFLAGAALRTLPGAVAMLRSCEVLLPAAEEIGVVKRSADAIALKICNEVQFPTRSPPDWWAAELAVLSPASFHKVMAALRCRRADPEVLTAAATSYTELALASVRTDGQADPRLHRARLESIVPALPAAHDAPLPAAFLCRLLQAAVSTEASGTTCRDLEHRVAAVLDHATAGDLLSIALDAAGERVRNVDTIQRIITAFVEREAGDAGDAGRAVLYGGGFCSEALQKVALVVDKLAAEIATEQELPISKFVGITGAVPKEARRNHDDLYRAVDIYLKAHPSLDEIEREKVCSVMDPLKLKYEARLHAGQNKRLPLQVVLSALYYDQLKLRSGSVASMYSLSPAASVTRGQAKADAALAQENEALRSELARMRAYVSGLDRGKGSASKDAKSGATPKKTKFFGSVTRTLNLLNPFKSGARDTSGIADGGDRIGAVHVAKPKRRRFSIS